MQFSLEKILAKKKKKKELIQPMIPVDGLVHKIWYLIRQFY